MGSFEDFDHYVLPGVKPAGAAPDRHHRRCTCGLNRCTAYYHFFSAASQATSTSSGQASRPRAASSQPVLPAMSLPALSLSNCRMEFIEGQHSRFLPSHAGLGMGWGRINEHLQLTRLFSFELSRHVYYNGRRAARRQQNLRRLYRWKT